MDINSDTRDLIQLFNDSKIKFLVVGGHAVNHYGYPRYTGDIDLWILTTRSNIDKVIQSIHDFGFSSLQIRPEDLTDTNKGQVVQIGSEPYRIDIMNSVDGLDFDSAYKRKQDYLDDGLLIPFVHVRDLIINKKTTARLQDLADAEGLEKVLSREIKKN